MNNYEPAPEYTAPAYRVTAEGFAGSAYRILGWQTEPDEDTEWSGYEVRTGNLVCVMVGDDFHWNFEPELLVPLEEGSYCRECGQIGCGHGSIGDE